MTRASFHQTSRSSFSRAVDEEKERCEKLAWSQPWLPITWPSRTVRRPSEGFASTAWPGQKKVAFTPYRFSVSRMLAQALPT